MADDEREAQASEVLHSLLSVERIEVKPLLTSITTVDDVDDSNIIWHTPVQGLQATFSQGDNMKSDLSSTCSQDQVCYTFS